MDLKMNGYCLVLDASCPQIQVAVFKDGKLLDHCSCEANAMDSLLSSVEKLAKENELTIAEVNNFAYCSGPGSVLGIRLSIIAIKTWLSIHKKNISHVYTFESLHLAAFELSQTKNLRDFAVISEWKKGHWNCIEFNSGSKTAPVKVWTKEQIEAFTNQIYLLPQRKIWSSPEIELPTVDYTLSTLESSKAKSALLTPLTNWKMYVPEAKEYVKWSKDRHR